MREDLDALPRHQLDRRALASTTSASRTASLLDRALSLTRGRSASHDHEQRAASPSGLSVVAASIRRVAREGAESVRVVVITLRSFHRRILQAPPGDRRCSGERSRRSCPARVTPRRLEEERHLAHTIENHERAITPDQGRENVRADRDRGHAHAPTVEAVERAALRRKRGDLGRGAPRLSRASSGSRRAPSFLMRVARAYRRAR